MARYGDDRTILDALAVTMEAIKMIVDRLEGYGSDIEDTMCRIYSDKLEDALAAVRAIGTDTQEEGDTQ